jgi:hypothetical protein
MANVGVTFDFAAESAKLRSEIDKVRKELSTLNASTQSIKEGFTAMGQALTGALSVGAITAFFVKVNGAADALNDLAQRSGASASGLQAIQLAAAQAGGSMDAVAPALAKMSVRIGEAMAGSKEATAAFDHLGLSVAELSTQKSDQAFRTILQHLSEIPNSAERAEAGTKILGKGYAEVAGLAIEGQKAIDQVNEALARQGATISDLDVAKIGVMNDELQFQGVVVENLGTKFLAGLAPSIGVATSTLSDMLAKLGGATDAGKGFGVIMVAAIKMIESAAYGLASVFETVRELIAGVLSVITGSVGDVIGAFGYLADAVGLDRLGASLKRGQDAMSGISESLRDISVQASRNADVAAAAMLRSAEGALNASEIYNQAQANFARTAAEAAARNAGAQGAGSGYQIPESLGGGAKDTRSPLDRLQTQNLNSLTSETRTDLARFDPAVDLRAINEDARNAYLLQQQIDHDATMLGQFENFNQTWLGQMLTANQAQIESEAYKNQTIGGMMGNLANMAIQSGGKAAKFGKAFAIASTIWSTAAAIMDAMGPRGPGYPANIAAAAGIAAMGVAQLANIKKTNVDSGGGVVNAASGGGGASSPALSNSIPATQPASTESQQKSAINIYVDGNLMAGQESVRWFADQLGALINNQDMVFINGNSRQAMELAG